VIEIIEQISARIPSSRIVIATPSNSAANLIIDRLLKTKRYKAGDFVRFVSFHQIEKELIPTELKKYCATIDIALDDGTRQTSSFYDDSGIRKHCSKTTIVQYQIYISTLSSLGPLMNIKFPPDHFTHIIIDEAGQSVETESLIPMTFLSKNRGQVILAGDPIQLGPVLHSYIAKHPSIGLGKSLLERLSEHEFYSEKCGPDGSSFNPNFVTKLKKNYRSIPSVLNVYNKLFYGGELEAEISDKNSYEIELLRKLSPSLWNRVTAKEGCGVFFVNVEGKHMRTKDSNSWCNDHEAMKVFTFICKLKKLGVGLENVGVVSKLMPTFN
jgi:RNA helicase armi